MPLRRILAVLLLAAALPAVPAARAEPLSLQKLAALAEAGLSDEAILTLVRQEGLAEPIGSDAVLALSEAGLSPGLLSRLVALDAEAIRVEERDGVTVVSGRGPDEWDEQPAEEPRESDDWIAGEPPVTAPVVVVQAPAVAAQQEPQYDGGYPAGATFGWSGGAVFLPARFGGSQPSAFGRTIVGMTPVLPGCAPVVDACCPAPALAPAMLPARHGRIPIDTSRGTLWVPN